MNAENNQNKVNKKKTIIFSLLGLAAFSAVVAGSFVVLSNIKDRNAEANSQEQFVGQAQSSDQLQAECQSSANEISESRNLKEAFDEYKKHAENCLEVYIVSNPSENRKIRAEGMYPDLAEDLIKRAVVENKAMAFEIIKFAKGLPAWEFYQGPIVCPSEKVLEAWEEQLSANPEKVCYKVEDFQEKIVSQLKLKNFKLLELLQKDSAVPWLSSTQSNNGCPEKLSNIIKIAQNAVVGPVQINGEQRFAEQNLLSVVFSGNDETDKLILEFVPQQDACLKFESALVPNLQTNE